MNAKTQNGQPLPLESHVDVQVPPFVKAIAVRLAWVSRGEEADIYRLLSRPYSHAVVTAEDSAQIGARFPFMVFPAQSIAVADYTIMLVTLWLNIEEMYHRGNVLPEHIMQALQKKTTTPQVQDCRESLSHEGEGCQPQRC